jgi:hypothetical protein
MGNQPVPIEKSAQERRIQVELPLPEAPAPEKADPDADRGSETIQIWGN